MPEDVGSERALATCTEDLIRFPVPTGRLTAVLTSRSGGSGTLWPLQAQGMHTVHVHTCKKNTSKQKQMHS